MKRIVRLIICMVLLAGMQACTTMAPGPSDQALQFSSQYVEDLEETDSRQDFLFEFRIEGFRFVIESPD